MVVAMTDNLCPSCAAPLRFSRAIFAPTSGDYGEIWRCTAADCGREVFRDEPRCATCGEIISGDAGVLCSDCVQDKRQALNADDDPYIVSDAEQACIDGLRRDWEREQYRKMDAEDTVGADTLVVAPPDFRADFLRRARGGK